VALKANNPTVIRSTPAYLYGCVLAIQS